MNPYNYNVNFNQYNAFGAQLGYSNEYPNSNIYPNPNYYQQPSAHMNPYYNNPYMNQSYCNNSTTSKYKDIESWLRTRKLLDNLSDEYIDNNRKFVEEIVIKIFGTWKKLIYHIIDDADKNNKNNDIYQIIKNEKDENNGNETDKNCYFDKISLTSITNICGYLDQNDIETFKCTSSSMAFQCLLEMKKCDKINVFNMNEFNHYYKYKYLSIASSLSIFKEFKNDRYPKPVALSGTSLMDIWSNKYQIHPKNIILLRKKNETMPNNYLHHPFLDRMLESDIMTAHTFYNIHNLQTVRRFNTAFGGPWYQWYISILDKTKTLFINSNGKLISETDDLELNNHVLILLYYFNIKKQNIEFCATVIVEQNTYYHQMTKCIENNIDLFMKNINNDDTKEFMEVFNNAKHPKITIFSDDTISLMHKVNKSDVVIFGLNDFEYFEYAKKYVLNEKFYSNPKKLRYNVRQRLKIRQQNQEHLEQDEKERDLLRLNAMSPEILQNICSFLSKEDKTIRVKLICTSIAIICLNGMELSHIDSAFILHSSLNNMNAWQFSMRHQYVSPQFNSASPPPPPPPAPSGYQQPSTRKKRRKKKKRRSRRRRVTSSIPTPLPLSNTPSSPPSSS